MTTTFFLLLLFIIYPLIVVLLNVFTRRKIPEQLKRRHYKRKHEYIIMLGYLLSPLFLFHLELFLWMEGYSFSGVDIILLIILFTLQFIVFIYGIYRLYLFISGMKRHSR